jgi:hypothetical protein
VQPSSGEEALAEPLAQPFEVTGITARGRRGGLDLDSYDVPAGELGHEVDLVTTVLLAQVVEASGKPPKLELWPDLRQYEGLDQTPEERAIPQDGRLVHAERARQQRRVDQTALGSLDQAGQPVAVSGIKKVEHEHVGP